MARKIKIGDVAKLDKYLICIQTPFENHRGDESMTVSIGVVGEVINLSYSPPRFRAYQIPTLHLPIGNSAKYGGAWFDLILSGVKPEEYREATPFYDSRLEHKWFHKNGGGYTHEFKPLKVLHLTNGYGHSRPQLWAHIESITIGRGNPEWGAPVDRDVFIIKLGAVFHSKNLKT